MASFVRYGSQSYAPSAPSLPEEHNTTSTTSSPYQPPPGSHGHSSSSYSYGQMGFSPYGHSGSFSSSASYSYGCVGFPPGTNPDVIRSFEMVDRDRSGFIDDNELQQALSSGYQRFSLRTIRLLISLFKNSNDPPRLG